MRKSMTAILALVLAVSLLPGALAEQKEDYAARTLLHEGFSELAVVQGRIVLSLSENRLAMLDPVTFEESPLEKRHPEAWNQVQDGQLISDGRDLYLLSLQEEALYPIAFEGNEASLAEPIALPGLPQAYPRTVALSETGLAFLTDAGLTLLSLQGEAARSLPLKQVQALTPYGAGRYAAVLQKRVDGLLETHLVMLDAQSGETSPLARIAPGLRVSRMAWAPGSPLVFEANNALWAFREGEDIQMVASLVRGDVFGLYLLSPDRAVVALDSLIALRTINPALVPAQKRLTVLDPLGRGEDYGAFLKEHGGVELVFPPFTGGETEERFIKDMVTRSEEIDIYLLKNQNLMATIRQKGYALDLAQDETLKAFAKDLYPAFLAFFQEGEAIYAVPKAVHLPVLAYNPEAFLALGLSVPTTWEEFFDLAIAWLSGLSDQHEDYFFEPFFYNTGIERLLTKYLDERAKNGLSLTCDTPAMKRLIQKYREANALAKDVPSQRGRERHLFHLTDVPYRGKQFSALPLVFEPGSQPALGFPTDSFSYFVVNPFSKNREEALAFLSLYEQNLPGYMRILISQSAVTPVEMASYPAQRAELDYRIAQVNGQLKTATGGEKNELQAQMESLTIQSDDLEANWRYEISPEDIKEYQGFSDKVYLSPMNPMVELTAAYPDLFAQIEDNPHFDASGFLKRLDEMIALMLLETQ